MNNYVLEVNSGQSNSAGTKAKQDVTYFLKRKNFKVVTIKTPKRKIMRLFLGREIISKSLKNIKSGNFVFQYPMYSRVMSNYLLNCLKRKKNIKKILVIHDIESLRLNKDERNGISKEISFFNKFDKVISHNPNMSKWLIENGLKVPVKNLIIFDYNNPQPMSSSKFDRSISFAGNLEKSKFLNKLKIRSDVYLMGPGATQNYPENIHYKGVFTPEEVPAQLTKGFGLVWDGDSIETCNGLFGEYMKFNNPHKVSLYLSSGMPVIIWNQSAMADFIKEKNIGIVTESLSNLDELLNQVTEENYLEMEKNVNQVAHDLRNGAYIYNAVLN